MPLGEWVQQRVMAVLHAIARANVTWPWDAEPMPTDTEMSLARKVLAERSAIRD